MSVHHYDTKDGARYQVRWREANGKVRTRTLTSKEEANGLDADIKARKFKGQALPRPGKETLAAAYDEWWRLRGSTLAPASQRVYQSMWNAHIKDGFDQHRMNQLASDPQLFEQLLAELREKGVGNGAQRKLLVVLSAVMTAAVDWQKIAVNPILRMRKPPTKPERYPRPFPPVVVERIRLKMLRRETMDQLKIRPKRDACLVSLMSYAGLRPGEALGLVWGDIDPTGTRTHLAIDKAVADGEAAPTKTRRNRVVPIPTALVEELDELRKSVFDRGDEQPLFPSHDGGFWSHSEFRNWRSRVWKPIVIELADGKPPVPRLSTARPYDCRGSFVSLQLRSGASPLEVAQWAGHSPAVMFKHYANVIDELTGASQWSIDDQIYGARQLVEIMDRRALDSLVATYDDKPISADSPLWTPSAQAPVASS